MVRKAGLWLTILKLVVLSVFLAVEVTSCAGGMNSGSSTTASRTRAATAEDSVRTTTTAISHVDAVSPDYGIGPGDVLDISVFQVPDLKRTVRVDTNGMVSFPLIGAVRVGGKTTSDAANDIAARLREKYLRSPQVSVLVSKSAQRVTVNGAVQKPGVITLDSSLSLSQAVAEAGGGSDVADESRVHIARLRQDSTVQDNVFDLTAIDSGKERDPRLQSGDIVVVESSGSREAFKTFQQLIPFGALAVAAGTGI